MSTADKKATTSPTSDKGNLVVKDLALPTDMDKKSPAERKGAINKLKSEFEKSSIDFLRLKVELESLIFKYNQNMINHLEMTQIHVNTRNRFSGRVPIDPGQGQGVTQNDDKRGKTICDSILNYGQGRRQLGGGPARQVGGAGDWVAAGAEAAAGATECPAAGEAATQGSIAVSTEEEGCSSDKKAQH